MRPRHWPDKSRPGLTVCSVPIRLAPAQTLDAVTCANCLRVLRRREESNKKKFAEAMERRRQAIAARHWQIPLPSPALMAEYEELFVKPESYPTTIRTRKYPTEPSARDWEAIRREWDVPSVVPAIAAIQRRQARERLIDRAVRKCRSIRYVRMLPAALFADHVRAEFARLSAEDW